MNESVVWLQPNIPLRAQEKPIYKKPQTLLKPINSRAWSIWKIPKCTSFLVLTGTASAVIKQHNNSYNELQKSTFQKRKWSPAFSWNLPVCSASHVFLGATLGFPFVSFSKTLVFCIPAFSRLGSSLRPSAVLLPYRNTSGRCLPWHLKRTNQNYLPSFQEWCLILHSPKLSQGWKI